MPWGLQKARDMKNIVLGLLVLLFVACAKKDDVNIQTRLMYALDLRERGFLSEAGDEMIKIAKKTGSHFYYKFGLSLLNEAGAKNFLSELNAANKVLKDDLEYLRLKTVALIKSGDLEQAQASANELIARFDSDDDRRILASIYLLKKEYERGILELRRLYEKNKNDATLAMLVEVSLNFFDPKDVKIRQYLQEYYLAHDCENVRVCLVLGEYLIQEKHYKNAIALYSHILELHNEHYTNQVIDLLVAYRLFETALEILNKYDDENYSAKMRIYLLWGKPLKAAELAHKLYLNTGRPEFLAQQAMYEYEGLLDRLDKQKLAGIAEKFKQSIALGASEANILNYYGYMLIQHDLDVAGGVALIKQALEKSPNSPYYLDSLAWGFYKLGQCDEAMNLMLKAIKIEPSFAKNKEAVFHLKKINRCLKKENDDIR